MTKQEGTATIPGYQSVTNKAGQAFAGEKKFQKIFEGAKLSKQSFCPVRDIINRISDKWSILTIAALGGYGILRFNELKKLIGDVSQKMLTVTLRNLEADGLITRKVYAEIPPRVEYELTPMGRSLLNQISHLADWAVENGMVILKSRKKKG